jgi:hypothetical protein
MENQQIFGCIIALHRDAADYPFRATEADRATAPPVSSSR